MLSRFILVLKAGRDPRDRRRTA